MDEPTIFSHRNFFPFNFRYDLDSACETRGKEPQSGFVVLKAFSAAGMFTRVRNSGVREGFSIWTKVRTASRKGRFRLSLRHSFQTVDLR